ncbi:MAG TPA: hypothetical protein VMV77_18135 [Bacteroidales bacterium]|nr:hypothetical protein [Bacteroidales bacterium]
MKHILVVILSAISCIGFSQVPAGVNINYGDALPIRGFCIAAPQPKEDNPRSPG